MKKYHPLIMKLSIATSTNEEQTEDMISIAQMELLKCMICYQRIGSFMTFLYGRIKGKLKHVRDSENRQKRIPILVNDNLDDIKGFEPTIDSKLIVQECLSCLDEEEFNVVNDIFFNMKTMREIHRDRGIFPAKVCQIKARALSKMRRLHNSGVI